MRGGVFFWLRDSCQVILLIATAKCIPINLCKVRQQFHADPNFLSCILQKQWALPKYFKSPPQKRNKDLAHICLRSAQNELSLINTSNGLQRERSRILGSHTSIRSSECQTQVPDKTARWNTSSSHHDPNPPRGSNTSFFFPPLRKFKPLPTNTRYI